ncbi:hypothetical protein nvc2_039 [Namao virus]|nr:hypothetical protein nvc2_039 [Namao virus]
METQTADNLIVRLNDNIPPKQQSHKIEDNILSTFLNSWMALDYKISKQASVMRSLRSEKQQLEKQIIYQMEQRRLSQVQYLGNCVKIKKRSKSPTLNKKSLEKANAALNYNTEKVLKYIKDSQPVSDKVYLAMN